MKFFFMKKTKKKGPKKGKKNLQQQESNPGSPTWKVNALSILLRQPILKIPVKLIIFNTFAHEILPVDAL